MLMFVTTRIITYKPVGWILKGVEYTTVTIVTTHITYTGGEGCFCKWEH